ncbi:MAG: hypothetical protein NVV74_12515 [Magnetospirillum sp.]|nr:hypothetical protein [Magnetospirillum sp.]
MSPSRYIATVVLATACILVAAGAASLYVIRNNLSTWHVSQLFRYQTEKLAFGPPIDVLLIGDSSLGNAIDARRWSTSTGSVVENVALTGAYGYAGSLQMLRRAVRHRRVLSAVIVQTPDMMTRAESHEGALFSAESFSDLAEVPLNSLVPWLLSKDIILNALRKPKSEEKNLWSNIKNNDYMPQGRLANFTDLDSLKFSQSSINNNKSVYLEKIFAFCNQNGIRCIYAHGPIVAPLCTESAEYYNTVNAAIRAVGFDLLETNPPCLTTEQVGDQPDHVRPSFKSAISDHYQDLITRWLQTPSASGLTRVHHQDH